MTTTSGGSGKVSHLVLLDFCRLNTRGMRRRKIPEQFLFSAAQKTCKGRNQPERGIKIDPTKSTVEWNKLKAERRRSSNMPSPLDWHQKSAAFVPNKQVLLGKLSALRQPRQPWHADYGAERVWRSIIHSWEPSVIYRTTEIAIFHRRSSARRIFERGNK